MIGALGLGAVALALIWLWGGPLVALVFGLPIAFLVALVRIPIGIHPKRDE